MRDISTHSCPKCSGGWINDAIVGDRSGWVLIFPMKQLLWLLIRVLISITLQWRQNEWDSVSNHQPHDCLLNHLFRRRKQQSSASLAFVWEIHREPVNSPHKWPVTRKRFPFDNVIMNAPDRWILPTAKPRKGHLWYDNSDILWWRHDKEDNSAYWPCVRRGTSGLPSQRASNSEFWYTLSSEAEQVLANGAKHPRKGRMTF